MAVGGSLGGIELNGEDSLQDIESGCAGFDIYLGPSILACRRWRRMGYCGRLVALDVGISRSECL